MNPINDAPTVANAISDVTVDEDASPTTIDLANVFSDIESDTLVLSVVSSDSSLVTAAIAGTTLTLTYVANANGNTTVVVTATETGTSPALSVSDTFSVTINAINDTPTVVIPISDVTVDEDADPTTIALASVFSDVESDALTLTVVSSNTSLVTAAIVGTTLTLTYVANATGNTTVVVTATETGTSPALSVSDTFSVTINAIDTVSVYTDNGVTYTYTIKPGTATDVIITGTTVGTALSGDIVIPDTFTISSTTYSVKEIGANAFQSSAITSVTIPASVTSIGTDTFLNCNNLATVSLWQTTADAIGVTFGADQSFFGSPNTTDWTVLLPTINGGGEFTVADWTGAGSPAQFAITGFTSIGANALEGQTTVTYVDIGASVTSIGANAFYQATGIKTVIFAADSLLAWIGGYAFQETAITSIEIPAIVNTIDAFAFYKCIDLDIVTFATDSVLNNIVYGAFSETAITSIEIPASVDYIGTQAFKMATKLAVVTFAAGSELVSIGNSAFQETAISSIIIPADVTDIDGYAFYLDASLTTVTIGASVTSIGVDAFLGCDVLTTVSLLPSTAEATGVTFGADQSLFGSPATTDWISLVVIIDGGGEFTVADWTGAGSPPQFVITGFTSIGANALNGQTTVTHVGIGASVTSIGDDAFRSTAITSIIIPASVISIGSYAFYMCNNLTTVTFDAVSVLESIGNGAFYATALTSIIIPASVISIGSSAFGSCPDLTTATFAAGSVLESIGGNAFSFTALTTIEIPASVISIGNYAFRADDKLTSVTFAADSVLESIGNGAFTGTAITSITIPASVISIGEYVFYLCTSLTSVTFIASTGTTTDGVTGITIDVEAFNGIAALDNVFIKDGQVINSIATSTSVDTTGVFFGSPITTTIRSYEITGTGVFNAVDYADAFSPPYAILAEGWTDIGDIAFQSTAITSITIPASVTSIGVNAFLDCIALATVSLWPTTADATGVTFGADQSLFGSPATTDWISLVVIIDGGGEFTVADWTGAGSPPQFVITGFTTIGANALEGQTTVTHVGIGASVTSIGINAFLNCNSLDTVSLWPSTADATGVTFGADQSLFGSPATTDWISLVVIIDGGGEFTVADWTGAGSPAQFAITGFTSIGANALEGQTTVTYVDIGASVTSIGPLAFDYCSFLTSVTFAPNSTLATIGEGAFRGSAISSINIPASVTDLGNYTFYVTASLTSVTFDTNIQIETIGEGAFSQSAITSITIPASVTSIGPNAFSRSALISIIIPAAVTSIEYYAFDTVTSLTSITIGESVMSIGINAFLNCNSLDTVSLWPSTADATGVTFGADQSLFGSPATTDWISLVVIIDGGGEFTVADWTGAGSPAQFAITGFTSIGTRALKGQTTVTHVGIGESVTSIGFEAFYMCASLTSVTFAQGSALATIGISAFGRTAITSIEIPATVKYILDDAFYQCVSLKIVAFAANSVLETIGISTFRESGLTSIEIPASVTSIGDYAFLSATGLASVSLWPSTADATEVAFGADRSFFGSPATTDWTSLTVIIDGVGVFTVTDWTGAGSPAQFAITGFTSIGANALEGQTTVTYVDIGASVTDIGESAFRDCLALSYVMIPSSTTIINNNAFRKCTLLTTVVFEPTSSITTIGADAFRQTKINSMTIPSSVTILGDRAFYQCNQLATIVFASGSQVSSIGIGTFWNNTSLGTITIPSTVTSIAKDAFYTCTNLTTVLFAANSLLESIGSSAFGMTGLTTIVIPGTVTFISPTAFSLANSLVTVYISGGQIINEVAIVSPSPGEVDFFGATNVQLWSQTIEYVSGSTIFTKSAWEAAGEPTVVILGNGWKQIATNAFATVTSITSIHISASVTHIGANAFINCSNLATVTFAIGSSLVSIGSSAFGHTAISSISIPITVKIIGSDAFANNSPALNTVYIKNGQSISNILFISPSSDNDFFGASNVQLWSPTIFYPESPASSVFTKTVWQSAGSPTTLIIGAGWTEIAADALTNTPITSIHIPASVTTIGANAFKLCTSLASVTFGPTSLLTTIGSGAFSNTVIQYIVIASGVTSIASDAFSESYHLNTVYIENDQIVSDISFASPSLDVVDFFGAAGVSLLPHSMIPSPNPICFPAGTPVTTDQGDVCIEKLNPSVHTIRGKKIVAVTSSNPYPWVKHVVNIPKHALGHNVPSRRTVISPAHQLYFKRNMVCADTLVGVCKGVTRTPYHGETLFNVLMYKHSKMLVNNLVCETLSPNNIVALISGGAYSERDKIALFEQLTHSITHNEHAEYRAILSFLRNESSRTTAVRR